MYVINQPWCGRGQRLGDHIVRLLMQDDPRFQVFRACAAFVKASGMLRLASALRSFLGRGGHVEIVAGVDEDHTSKQGLELVLKYSTRAFVFHNPRATFHPKTYLFEIPDERATVFVGSSNITVGGLFTNYESNLGVEFNLAVERDRQTYENLLTVFGSASDVTSGNAKRLDAALLKELVRQRRLADETHRIAGRASGSRAAVSEAALFSSTPILPAPRIPPDLAGLIPRLKSAIGPDAHKTAPTDFQPWEMFLMVLGQRDTRQMLGYSRDIYIPLAARDANPRFWDWPGKFRAGRDKTVGKYRERRIRVLVRPVTGQSQVVEAVRLYYYDIKHEFRLNCARLVEAAEPGDLLVVHKSPPGTRSRRHTCEFEATVVSSADVRYQTFALECSNSVAGSPKRWGYA